MGQLSRGGCESFISGRRPVPVFFLPRPFPQLWLILARKAPGDSSCTGRSFQAASLFCVSISSGSRFYYCPDQRNSFAGGLPGNVEAMALRAPIYSRASFFVYRRVVYQLLMRNFWKIKGILVVDLIVAGIYTSSVAFTYGNIGFCGNMKLI